MLLRLRPASRTQRYRYEKDQKPESSAFWRFVSVVGAVAFAGGLLGNFLRVAVLTFLDWLFG